MKSSKPTCKHPKWKFKQTDQGNVRTCTTCGFKVLQAPIGAFTNKIKPLHGGKKMKRKKEMAALGLTE